MRTTITVVRDTSFGRLDNAPRRRDARSGTGQAHTRPGEKVKMQTAKLFAPRREHPRARIAPSYLRVGNERKFLKNEENRGNAPPVRPWRPGGGLCGPSEREPEPRSETARDGAATAGRDPGPEGDPSSRPSFPETLPETSLGFFRDRCGEMRSAAISLALM